jgi:SAM-dependent methyltransferase
VLVNATDISELAGVSNPAVVTNWRSRSADFPTDRSGGRQPKFDLVEVLEWMRRSGRALPGITPPEWWEMLVRAFALQATVPNPRSTLVAVLVLRHAAHDGRTPDGAGHWASLEAAADGAGRDGGEAHLATVLARVTRDLEAWRPELNGLLVDQLTVDAQTGGFIADLIDALGRAADIRTAELLEPVLRLGRDGRAKPPLSTDETLADAMIELAQIPPGGSVLDPAAGEGTLLIRSARTTSAPLQLFGQELDADAWLTARSRMFIEGVDADLAQPGDDSLRRDQHRDRSVDIVLIDPPFADDAPPLHLWIEHGLVHLRPGGRLVIALPLHALVDVKVARRRPEKMLRSLVTELASGRLIHCVRMLPRGLRNDIVGPLAIITLGQAATETGSGEIRVELDTTALRRVRAERTKAARDAEGRDEASTAALPGGPALKVLHVAPDGLLDTLDELGREAEAATGASRAAGDERRDVRSAAIELLEQLDAVRERIEPDVYQHLEQQIDKLRRAIS